MNEFLIIVIAIVLSAFFSGMEMAFIASNKLIIELDQKQGAYGSRIIKFFAVNPGQYIATMLIGNNIALVIYGLFFSKLLNPLLFPFFRSEVLVLIINTFLSTALILTIAEFLPKTIFIISPNFFLKLLSIPTLIFFFIFYPIAKLTLSASNLFIRIFFRLKPSDKVSENQIFGKVDLDHYVNLIQDDKPDSIPDNIKIFQNALDFSNVKLRECMVPRTEIVAIEMDSPVSELRSLFIETEHSRLLVYKGSIDNIIGYFELKDIFKDPPDIKSLIRRILIVPETMAANKLLKLFVEEKKNVALVVDEFGGTSGMVTIEDVLEEIVGDIEDEHDINELTEKVINDKEYIFAGRLEIDYLNEKYQLELPEEDDYETLAGMILYHYGSIPRNNDIIRIKNMVFKVIKATSTKLELVNMKIH